MTQFDDREKGFEKKFMHDEALRFKAEARRNKLVGLWAAELLGRSDAAAYAVEVIESDFEEAGDHDVVRKLVADFDAANVEMSEHRIRKALDENFAIAKEQIMNEID